MNNKYMRKHADGGLDESLSIGAFMRKSPFIEGLKSGIKAGLIGAGIGAAHGALTHGARAKRGTLVGGLGGLLVGGLVGAGAQEVSNRRSEADMSYHMRRLMSRHPGITLPPEIVAQMSAEEGGATIGAGSPRAFERYGPTHVIDDTGSIF